MYSSPKLDQRIGQVAADEAGRSRDQDYPILECLLDPRIELHGPFPLD